MQRFLAVLLILAGLGAAGYGIATATILRESDTVVATATPSGDGTMVVTAPGVLGMVDSHVTVRASVPEGQKVTLAVGTETDVLGWVGDDPYDSVTGMADWTRLSVVPGGGVSGDEAPAEDGEDAAEGDKAEGEKAEKPAEGPEPAGSDMWVSEVSGETSVTLRYTAQAGPYVLLAAGVGKNAEAPTVELTWPRPVTTPYLWPCVIGGGFLLLVGVFLILGSRGRKTGKKDARKAPRKDGKGANRRRPVREPLTHTGDLPRRGEPGEPPFPPAAGDDAAAAFPPAADRPGPSEAAPFPPSVAEPAAGTFAPGRGWGSAPTPPPAPGAEPGAVPAAPAAAWAAPGRSPSDLDAPTGAQPVTGPPAPGSLRRRRGAPGVTPPSAPPRPAPAPGPGQPTGQQPVAAPGSAAPGQPSSGRMMTRRERRLAEQAGQVGRGGNTAAQPVVPQQPAAPAAQPEQTSPSDQGQSGRAAAWRAAWGINDQDGENR